MSKRKGLQVKYDKDFIFKSKIYKSLYRSYGKVRNYCDFNAVAYRLTALIMGVDHQYNAIKYELEGNITTPSKTDKRIISSIFEDEALLKVYESSNYLRLSKDFPVRFLDRSLYESFLRTSLPNHLEMVNPALPYGIIVLPETLINPEGDSVEWVGFHVFKSGETRKKLSVGGNYENLINISEDFDVIRFFFMASNLSAYCSDFGIKDGGFYYGDGNDEFTSYDSSGLAIVLKEEDPENLFVSKIKSLVIQTLLYLQTRPEDVTPVNPYSLAPVEPKQAKKGGKKRYTPLMIGKQFKPKTETVSLGGTHASPRTHWRRGHWRRVAIGEGRNDRKWHWFQPVLVNG
jgi:hypothetical protein